MPKAKKIIKDNKKENKEDTKEVLLDDEEKALDPELMAGDIISEDEGEDDETIADDDEVDPFKDRWEE